MSIIPCVQHHKWIHLETKRVSVIAGRKKSRIKGINDWNILKVLLNLYSVDLTKCSRNSYPLILSKIFWAPNHVHVFKRNCHYWVNHHVAYWNDVLLGNMTIMFITGITPLSVPMRTHYIRLFCKQSKIDLSVYSFLSLCFAMKGTVFIRLL